MRFFLRFIFVTLACVAVAGGATYWLTLPDRIERSRSSPEVAGANPRSTPRAMAPPPYPSPSLPTFPDPTGPTGASDRVFIDPQAFDSLIGAATAQFTDKVEHEGSLREYRPAIANRAVRAKAQLRARNELVRLDPSPTLDQSLKALWIYRQFAFVALYEGDHDEAAAWLKKALALS